MGPEVALVSAAIWWRVEAGSEGVSLSHNLEWNGMEGNVKLTTTPPSYMHPTIVVPVLVALGSGTPRACSAALRL